MNKIKHHRELCDQIHTTYEKKNHDYGDSFGQSIAEHGYIAGVVRIEDKMNRVKSLIKNGEAHVKDESLCDTLLDLANYAIMLSMAVEKGSKNNFYGTENIGKLEEESEKSEEHEEHEELYGRRAFEKAVELYVKENEHFFGFTIQYYAFHTQLTLMGMCNSGLYNKICILRPIDERNLDSIDYFIAYLDNSI